MGDLQGDSLKVLKVEQLIVGIVFLNLCKYDVGYSERHWTERYK